MTDCIFCKIVNKEIPSSTVYEDEHTLAFLDIAPGNKGHCLVIPKKHYESAADTPDEELGHIIAAGKKVGNALKQALDVPAFNVLANAGKEAGQVVFHTHFHIIPRFNGDELNMTWKGAKYEEGEMDTYLEKIKEKL